MTGRGVAVGAHLADNPSARRLAHLFDISMLLTGSDPMERVVPRLVTILTSEMAFRSAVFVLDVKGRGQTIDWHAGRVGARRRVLTRTGAMSWASYLCGRSRTAAVEIAAAPQLPRRQTSASSSARRADQSLTLPLVVAGGPIFGALQLVGVTSVDEADLAFANRVAGLLAVALERRATLERRQVAADVEQEASATRVSRAARSREHLEALVDNLDGAFVWEADANSLALTYVSGAAVALLGSPLRDWLAEQSTWLERIHPDDRPSFSAMLRAVRAGFGEPPRDHRWLTHDHRAIWLRTGVHLAGTADQPRFQGVSVDVTVAKENEARIRAQLEDLTTSGRARPALDGEDLDELRSRERAQRFLADESVLLAASLDPQVTRDLVAGLTVPTLADVCFVDLLGDDGATQLLGALCADAAMDSGAWSLPPSATPEGTPQRRVMMTGEMLLLEDAAPFSLRSMATEGRADQLPEVPIRSLVVMPLISRGRILGTITFAMTSSNRSYRQEHLTLLEAVTARAAVALDNAGAHYHEAERRRTREDILAVVAHDLRNPLAVVVGGASLLSQTEPSERQSRIVAMIRRAADRMNHLIGDLLDASSLDGGRLSVTKEPHRADHLLTEALEALPDMSASKSIRVACDAGDAIGVLVACDRMRILQVFSNLLANAVKFTPDQGAIHLAARVDGSEVVFSVADTGVGLSQQQADHVFDRFWQARETSPSGIGLGLSISKGIVESHGGRIWVDSVEGEGSTFLFTVMIARQSG